MIIFPQNYKTYNFDTGEVFIGEILNDVPNGKGIMLAS